MEASKKYRISQFIAASARPVGSIAIAAGLGLSEKSVREIAWCLEHHQKAIRKIDGQRSTSNEPSWVAIPTVTLSPDERRGSRHRRPARDPTQEDALPDWPPCELARVWVWRARGASGNGSLTE